MFYTLSNKQLLNKLAEGSIRGICRVARSVAHTKRAVATRVTQGIVQIVRGHRSTRLERTGRDDEGATIAMIASIAPGYPLISIVAIQYSPAKSHDDPSVLLQ